MKTTIAICNGTGCIAMGAERITQEFEEEIKKRGLNVGILKTGCPGFCERGPLITINPGDIFYSRISSDDIPEIIEETILKERIIDRLLYEDKEKGKIICSSDIPFYKKQVRRVLALNDKIDPTNIEDYIKFDGYFALRAALQKSPDEIIDEIKKSGLRGRGGGGFPTGRKWELARKAKGIKYVICNGDEGDPGAFMDRAIMEGNPHSVLEGTIIAGYAIGASYGYVYVRTEYQLAVKHMAIAIKEAERLGFLGKDILKSNFSFSIKIREGAGAFVCGEETALIASIEGKRGMPRPKPPFPVQSGVFGRPTTINNVETFANIPYIIKNGSGLFAGIGTLGSKGTKVFALAGKVNNTGLVEVPMGITLREVIFGIGGGITGNKKFKAVQLGGPSGGVLEESSLDCPVDYDTLIEKGAIMGSGGMIIMDETDCMVEIARFFLDFTQKESCGKCVPCRIGTRKMLDILVGIIRGKGKKEDIDELLSLSYLIKESSLCGLGQTAPNPVISTIKNFYNDYKTHIEEKFCPLCKAKGVFPLRRWQKAKEPGT